MRALSYTLTEIADVVGGTLSGKDQPRIEHLELDSRRISFPETTLFFAIRGVQHDGHRFIAECYEKGVCAFMVEKSQDQSAFPEAGFLLVSNAVAALQALAAHHRSRFPIPVIGITGSNGKTIVKEWLTQLLTPGLNIVKSPKSYNSQVGVPLSVWRMNEHHQVGIFEAGISQPGEMDNLEPIIRPEIGIFTNIGSSHDAGFSDIEEKMSEKLKLFEHADTLIYCRDHTAIHDVLGKVLFRGTRFTWSLKGNVASLQIDLRKHGSQSEVIAHWKEKNLSLALPFSDDASVENALHCLSAILCLDVDVESILPRFSQLHNLPLRLEMKRGIANSTIIYDCYNADLDSLALALDFMAQHDATGSRTVILSDILQSGRKGEDLYGEAARLLALKGVNEVIGVGEEISACRDVFEVGSTFYYDTAEFIRKHPVDSLANKTILLKGARKFQFERIGQFLERKAHQTVLEIDLNALAHNLSVYRGLLQPNVKVMVMVKALSYGAGSHEIAQLMQFHQVHYLAVAYTDEGMELRQSGIRLPIMVMNPSPGDLELLAQNDLEPEIFDLPHLKSFLALTRSGNIHLKLETGMNRLGFAPSELVEALALLGTHPEIRVKSLFSHLAASDDPRHDEFTGMQLQHFQELCERIEHELGYMPMRHILNSSGIVRFPQHQFEMVRLGIGLYGVDTTGNIAGRLLPISSLRTIVSQVKNVSAGESVGYDRAFIASNDMRIATIGIGYADGYRRSLGNGRSWVVIRGKRVPTVGNICMDMTMVDVTSLSECEAGDEAEVFGRNISVAELAQWAGTSAYEIISTISSRVKRVYLEE